VQPLERAVCARSSCVGLDLLVMLHFLASRLVLGTAGVLIPLLFRVEKVAHLPTM
jgi:hypothetical protein